ncbi:PREDICTED: uncharacterized protein LOC109317933 [Crocodylus porosus]|uniref:uncharacterized protein LOC109317933 n=1 Tax=Crocodylus porosus TaxID=8502 RepID=UPI00093DE5C2|nr:PREDICTED: uncharacterized protein LOC109317933 [Crocodylus porosus]
MALSSLVHGEPTVTPSTSGMPPSASCVPLERSAPSRACRVQTHCVCLDGFAHLDPHQPSQYSQEVSLQGQVLQLLDLSGCAKLERFVLGGQPSLFPALQGGTVPLQSWRLPLVPVTLASTAQGAPCCPTPRMEQWATFVLEATSVLRGVHLPLHVPRALFWPNVVASQAKIASSVWQAGSALSEAKAHQRDCVKKDGFAHWGLCQAGVQLYERYRVLSELIRDTVVYLGKKRREKDGSFG